VAYGALAALDDRPRPGKEPTITSAAKAWLVSLACDKAKEHGHPHELWTTRLLARHAREHGPAAGHECLANLVQGSGVQDPRPRGNQATQGALLSGTPMLTKARFQSYAWVNIPTSQRKEFPARKWMGSWKTSALWSSKAHSQLVPRAFEIGLYRLCHRPLGLRHCHLFQRAHVPAVSYAAQKFGQCLGDFRRTSATGGKDKPIVRGIKRPRPGVSWIGCGTGLYLWHELVDGAGKA
jgi:hypothetical protein